MAQAALQLPLSSSLPSKRKFGITCKVQVPDAPLLLSGLIGGPVVICSLTPYRNLLGLASQDSTSSIRELSQQLWRGGGVRSFYRGALPVVPSSMVQFSAVGPLYHAFAGMTGSASLAVALSAATETAVIFGPERRGVQLGFNGQASPHRQVRLGSYLKPWGPGVGALYMRNLTANCGIRVLSDPIADLVQKSSGRLGASVAPGTCKVAGDLLSSVACGGLSMPANQIFYFSATSREMQEARSLAEKKDLVLAFLRKQYLTEGGGISKVMLRDLTIRAAYIGTLFTMYAGVERAILHVMAPTAH